MKKAVISDAKIWYAIGQFIEIYQTGFTLINRAYKINTLFEDHQEWWGVPNTINHRWWQVIDL